MTSFAQRYEQLQWEILIGRELDTLSEEEEDRILERMDECWWKMLEDERAEAERRISDAVKIASKKSLDVFDVEVPFHGTHTPRKAA